MQVHACQRDEGVFRILRWLPSMFCAYVDLPAVSTFNEVRRAYNRMSCVSISVYGALRTVRSHRCGALAPRSMDPVCG